MFRQPLDLRGRRIGAKYVPQGRFQHLVAPAADALNRGRASMSAMMRIHPAEPTNAN
jgi:hypothetical protein